MNLLELTLLFLAGSTLMSAISLFRLRKRIDMLMFIIQADRSPMLPKMIERKKPGWPKGKKRKTPPLTSGAEDAVNTT